MLQKIFSITFIIYLPREKKKKKIKRTVGELLKKIMYMHVKFISPIIIKSLHRSAK